MKECNTILKRKSEMKLKVHLTLKYQKVLPWQNCALKKSLAINLSLDSCFTIYMCNDLPKNIFLSKLSTTFSRTGVKSLKDKHGATALLEVFDSMTLCHRFSWVRLSYKRKWKSVKFRIIHRCHNQLPHAGVGTSLFYFVKSPVSSHLPSILW